MFDDTQCLPGRKPVLELLRSTPEKVESVLLQKGLHGEAYNEIVGLCRQNKIRFDFADKQKLDLAYQGAHQGVLARIISQGLSEVGDLIELCFKSPLPLILALDQVQDSGNLGALARTLLGLGGAGIILPRHNSARLGPEAMKASAGALGRIALAKPANLSQALDECDRAGLSVYGSDASEQALNVFTAKLNLPCVLVLGGENKGMRPGVAKRCAAVLRIPLPGGFESLNVAQAGAIILGQFARAALG